MKISLYNSAGEYSKSIDMEYDSNDPVSRFDANKYFQKFFAHEEEKENKELREAVRNLSGDVEALLDSNKKLNAIIERKDAERLENIPTETEGEE